MAQVVADQNAAFAGSSSTGGRALPDLYRSRSWLVKLLPTLEQHVSLATQTATSAGRGGGLGGRRGSARLV